jgi:hypothetical protein
MSGSLGVLTNWLIEREKARQLWPKPWTCDRKNENIWVPASALIVRGQMETVFVAADRHA